MMISSASRQILKARAHALKPVVLLGAKGLTPSVMEEINLALDTHELIKVKLAGVERDDRSIMKERICNELKAECIQSIGMVIVLYRKKPNKK